MQSIIFALSILIFNSTNITHIESNIIPISKISYHANANGIESEYYLDVDDVYKVGHETLNINPNYKVEREYSTFIKVFFPAIKNVENASLKITKLNGDAPLISAYYYNYDIDFTSTMPNPTGSLGLFESTDNVFDIDISNAVNSSVNSLKPFTYIKITRSYNGLYSELYSENNVNNSPSVTFDFLENIGTTSYGRALEYHRIVSTFVGHPDYIKFLGNCFAYALDVYPNDSGSIFLGQYGKDEVFSSYILNNEIANNIITKSLEHNRFLRKIDSYNSPIYSNERRIAFRLSLNNNIITAYHFIRQNSDGSWSGKIPTRDSALYNNENPELFDWGDNYNSEIIYFALS